VRTAFVLRLCYLGNIRRGALAPCEIVSSWACAPPALPGPASVVHSLARAPGSGRELYCAFGCVLGGAVLDGAALGFALALACFFFFGVVSAPGVPGGALGSCWASASDAVSHRSGGHRERSGQPCEQKYLSARN